MCDVAHFLLIFGADQIDSSKIISRKTKKYHPISWQQTETAICYSRRPRDRPNCHVLWCPVIFRCRTQSLESASGRHSCDWLSQLL